MNEIVQHVVGNTILDYGCGYGKLAASFSGKIYTGVDTDKSVIDYARKLHSGKEHMQFYTLDEFIFQDHKYDSIIMAAVIEHLDEPAHILKNLKAHLAEGGRVIITTPTPLANEILKLGAKFRLFSKEGIEQHQSLLKKQDFISISQKIGLTLRYYGRFEVGLNQIVVYETSTEHSRADRDA
ncbi:class I SAM-dependent methyltransferase [Methanoculleus bourgensis]|uniref:class I SAM-dependent methyltransferase n=1 Tax=Methanoculleus bourgensis TaxID=83986 RepID=UPI002491E8DF|nr:class I SAM-dependent methyltransferase [Methanoculleus bourgensis]